MSPVALISSRRRWRLRADPERRATENRLGALSGKTSESWNSVAMGVNRANIRSRSWTSAVDTTTRPSHQIQRFRPRRSGRKVRAAQKARMSEPSSGARNRTNRMIRAVEVRDVHLPARISFSAVCVGPLLVVVIVFSALAGSLRRFLSPISFGANHHRVKCKGRTAQ